MSLRVGQSPQSARLPKSRWLAWAMERVRIEVALGIAAFVWFVIVGSRTPVDVDEGFYGLAGELVARGRVPYRDFFYPQAPLHPYVLAPFIAVLGAKLVVLRVVSAAFAAVASALVAHAIHRETGSVRGATIAVVLFVTHELSWQWLPSIRPYGAAEICILGSFILATKSSPRARDLMFSGVLASIAVLLRLPLAPIVGVAPLALLLDERKRLRSMLPGAFVLVAIAVGASLPPQRAQVGTALAVGLAFAAALVGRGAWARLTRVAWYVLGLLLFLVPVAIAFVLRCGRDVVTYDLIGFHADTSSVVSFPHNIPYLASTIGGGAVAELSGMGTQNAVLVIANLAALTLPRRSLVVAPLVGSVALVVGASRHQPIIEHYMTPIVGYLAIGAGMAFGYLDRWLVSLPNAITRATVYRAARALLAGVLSVFVLVGWSSFERKWIKGRYGGWDDRIWRPMPLDAKRALVARAVKENPGPLLATWPGSALGSAEHVMSGYENHFGRVVADRKSPEQAARLHLAGDAELRKAIMDRVPRVVVLDREAGVDAARKTLGEYTVNAGYVERGSIEDVTIYVRTPR